MAGLNSDLSVDGGGVTLGARSEGMVSSEITRGFSSRATLGTSSLISCSFSTISNSFSSNKSLRKIMGSYPHFRIRFSTPP